MNIPAGWYVVPGTSDVRWWDGQKFRAVTLVDGRVKYSQLVSAQPNMTMIVAAIFAALGLFRIFASTQQRIGTASDVFFGVVILLAAGFMVVASILGYQVQKLQPPVSAPVWDPRVGPFIGQTEYGPVPPGWYPGLTRRFPRWWTGARWSEYQLLQHYPMPTHPLRRQQQILFIVMAVFCAILLVVFAVLTFANFGTSYDWLKTLGIVLFVFFAVFFAAIFLIMRWNLRSVTVPPLPPGQN